MLRKLTPLELILAVLVLITMVASIILSLCLFLVLPKYWTRTDYIRIPVNRTYLIHRCKCELRSEFVSDSVLNTSSTQPPTKKPLPPKTVPISVVTDEQKSVSETTLTGTVTKVAGRIRPFFLPRLRYTAESQTKATFSRRKIKSFPYLVSLSIPAYIDEQRERKFACNGVIVTKKLVLTGNLFTSFTLRKTEKKLIRYDLVSFLPCLFFTILFSQTCYL